MIAIEKILPLLLLLSVGLVACQQEAFAPDTSQEADLKPAAEKAIRSYLESRPNLAMDRMDLEVEDVQVEGDTAVAKVIFRTKEGEGAMPFTYNLRREGDGWAVVPKDSREDAAHLPPNHPSASQKKDPAPAH